MYLLTLSLSLLVDGPVTNMCPPRTDATKTEAIHTGAEIEVKPPENCLTHALQVNNKCAVLCYAGAEMVDDVNMRNRKRGHNFRAFVVLMCR